MTRCASKPAPMSPTVKPGEATAVFLAKQRAREAIALLGRDPADDQVRRALLLVGQAAGELRAELERRGLDPVETFARDGRQRTAENTTGRAGRPNDPPPASEILKVLHAYADDPVGWRGYAWTLTLWRGGFRASEALNLHEADLNREVGTIYVERGKGGKSRDVIVDPWLFDEIDRWAKWRAEHLPPGPLFCPLRGRTAGLVPWAYPDARKALAQTALAAGVRRRWAPHQLRHAYACELIAEGYPLPFIQRQLGHSNLAVTTTQGEDS
jgi:integrase